MPSTIERFKTVGAPFTGLQATRASCALSKKSRTPAMGQKLPIDRARQIFLGVGLELLSSTYSNSKSPLQYRCKICGRKGKKPLEYAKAGHGCPACGRLRIADSHRHSITFANQAFADRGLELRELHYQHSQTPMAYLCRTCGYEGKLRLNDVINGVGCRKCGIKKRFEKHRIDFLELKRQLRARGIEVLSPDCVYRASRIRVRCNKCLKEWEFPS